MPRFQRYALYYAPPPGSALAQFGAAWLGWDAAAGGMVAHPDLPGLPQPVSTLSARPRKYGFHGTLKPPFALAEGITADELFEAAAALASGMPAFEIPRLEVKSIGSFLAIVPAGPVPPIAALAASCVQELDRFRAAPTLEETAKRRALPLTPRQEALLQAWGYPYVLDEFRFHLTLTGPLDPSDLAAVEAALTPKLADILSPPQPVQDICVFGEAEDDGRFHVITRLPLTG
ncbi:MAG: DUF1045 domain-containing protein [Pseudomonadota bacterium]